MVGSRSTSGDRRQVKRWLVLTLGLGVAAIAGLSLLAGGDFGAAGGSGAAGRQGLPVAAAAAPAAAAPQHDVIDKASRDQLRAILREADRQEANAP